ncbi:Anaphase-promoting complex subunit 2 [Coemansia sp. RSA 2702]|nr:Anaphase-promoting complex subunit 2 [Coemansia sp. RSA 2705]KAJ2328388.1 Anaphase-promoting complex subunit 2 [Coemansia sp. RSA 2702]KAJ2739463.1 Anaphase-promoting complex subunit 2 [Coemansia sp. Cherry 401B]
MFNAYEPLPDAALSALVQQVKLHNGQRPSAVSFAATRIETRIDKLAASCSAQLMQLHDRLDTDCIGEASALPRFSAYLNAINAIQQQFMREARTLGGDAHSAGAQMAWNALAFQAFDGEAARLLEEWLYLSLTCVLRVAKTRPSLLKNRVDGIGLCLAGVGDDEEFPGSAVYAQVCGSEEQARALFDEFAAGCQHISKLHALEYTRGHVLRALDRLIADQVQAQRQQWETRCLDKLHEDIQHIARLLDALLSAGATDSIAAYAENQLYQLFSAQRVGELFSVIVDYPDSLAAIDDLRACVERLGNMRTVAHSLRGSIERRLLHPGATTNDVLMQYISAIRCLRLLDPSSTVLEIVARPIRAYLRQRDDTVACIVRDMVSEDGESELFEDMAHGMQPAQQQREGVVYDEDCLGGWQPLPIEAKSVYRSAQRRDADVLSLLVSIYDTQDVFVHEFEAHLAERLLDSSGFDVGREAKQVEMMKLRFGGSALERCEVMLKDMADSKRVWQSQLSDAYSALVVSRQFWADALPTEPFALPPAMRATRERYAGVFESLKPARKLEWRDAQSRVDVCVELQDRTLNLSVRPSQAAVLFAFGSAPRMALAELALALECSEEFALPRVRFWLARGVLREPSQGVFEVVEAEGQDNGGGSATAADAPAHGDSADAQLANSDDEEEAGGASSAADARLDALRMHFNYIVGMLTNFGPLPLDRIHSMLGMFIPGDTTTADELRAFLTQMVREDRLDMAGGMYRLK